MFLFVLTGGTLRERRLRKRNGSGRVVRAILDAAMPELRRLQSFADKSIDDGYSLLHVKFTSDASL